MDLINRGEAALAILGLLTKHIRQSILTKTAVAAGENPGNISRLTGLPSYAVTSYRKYVNHITMTKFDEALSLCGQADRLLKSSSQAPDLVIGQIIEALT